MNYRIIISKRALKELELVPSKPGKQIISAINHLSVEPRPLGCKKLKGQNEDFWRIRINDYRVIYLIGDEVKIVEVRRISHRKNIYKDL